MFYGAVAHEIAHQWLGNLVTMAWWDDLWLNDSRSPTWMATKASERFHPEWRVVLQAQRGPRAGDGPGRPRRHAIRSTSRSPPRARPRARSTGITYEKGGGFLRMLEAWLARSRFAAASAPTSQASLFEYHRHRPVAGSASVSGEPVAHARRRLDDPARLPPVSVDARCEEDGAR